MNEAKIRAMVAAAYSDGYFDSRELYLINQKAKELGLGHEAILDIIRSPESENAIQPITKREKLEYMYDFMRIIYADEVISKSEKVLFFKYLDQLDFVKEIQDSLFDLMLKSVKDKIQFDEFFNENF